MFIFKYSVILAFFQNVDFSLSVQIRRELNIDTLSCSGTSVNCSWFDASKRNDTSCSCNNGTFFFNQDDKNVKCIKDAGQKIGCNYHFKYFEGNIQGIKVGNSKAGEFLYEIVTGQSCSQIEISKVEWLGEYGKWTIISNSFQLTRVPNTSRFFLRWNNTNEASSYSGQLLKITLICQALNGAINNGCLMGKVFGEKSWTKESMGFDVCAGEAYIIPTTTAHTMSKTLIKTSVIAITDPEKSSQDGTNIALIAGLIIGLLIIIATLIVIKFIYQRNRRKARERKIKEDNGNEAEKIYYETKGYETSLAENPAYLTSLRNGDNTNAINAADENYVEPNTEKTQPLLLYTKPTKKTKKPKDDQKSQTGGSTEQEYVELEDEYETLKVSSLPNYERLSISEDVNGVNMEINSDDRLDDDYSYSYEPTTPSKTKPPKTASESPHDYFQIEDESYEHLAVESPPKYQRLSASEDQSHSQQMEPVKQTNSSYPYTEVVF